MSTPFKPEWLQPGAVIPVDIPTLAAFAEELRRVNQENQALRQANERCEEHPDHQTGMIQERMQEEIDELRQALEAEQEPGAWISERGDVFLLVNGIWMKWDLSCEN